jgi:uncharacterized membrane protein
MNPLVRAALIGAATGGRNTSGVAAVSLVGADPPGFLRKPVARVLTGGAYLFELVTDKLPNTPSRLSGAGLGPRIATGAAVPLLLNRGSTDTRVTVALPLVGAAASLAASFAGARFRIAAAKRGPRVAFAAAVLEDLVVVAIAVTAVGAVTRAR